MLQTEVPFAQHQWRHTTVTHKKKAGVPQQFVARKVVVLHTGDRVECIGGTQKVDGYWASLRRGIGRRSIPTGEAGTRARAWLLKLVRVHQWHWWNLNQDRFELFGKLLDQLRPQG